MPAAVGAAANLPAMAPARPAISYDFFPAKSPAAPAAASSAAWRGGGDMAFQRLNARTLDRILDVFHRHNHALFYLLRSTRSEAPAEQETLDEFPDPRSPECLNLKVHNATSMKY